jgi:hypothetical protein
VEHPSRSRGSVRDPIAAYSAALGPAARALCSLLRKEIDAALPVAASKVWHGAPVWFVGENPVVGYSAAAKGVALLFWNGQAFGDERLRPVGNHGAAQAVFSDVEEIDGKSLRRWLKLAGTKIFDSKAYFARLRAKKQKKKSGT